jgi:B12-binding domain/radical SAM domain protein
LSEKSDIVFIKMKNLLILRKKKTNRNSIATLVGAIEVTDGLSNWDIKFFDAPNTLPPLINAYKHIIIAYSFMTADLPEVTSEIKKLKELVKNKVIFIAGGPHPSGSPQDVLNLGFDYVFVNEAELTLPLFLKRCQEGKTLSSSSERIIKDGRIDINKFPPFGLRHNFLAPIEISRGCPWGCKFCQAGQIHGNKMRHRSIDNIIEYIKEVVKNRGWQRIWFISPNAFAYGSLDGYSPNLAAIEELLAKIKEVGMKEIYFGSFPAEARPESVNEAVLKVVRKYCNNKMIMIGVQSGSDRLLKFIARGHDTKLAFEAIKNIKSAGFIPHVDFMFGLPTEDIEDRKKTFEFISKIVKDFGAKIHAHTFMPLPGTMFSHQTPSELDTQTLHTLGELTRKGIVTGCWYRQRLMKDLINYHP